ncbi:hypothetical protein LguiB_026424 [Lonicera macranthoides]
MMWNILDKMNYVLLHTFRENNSGADFLANLGCESKKKVNFVGVENLPKKLKGMSRMDRMGIPNVRFQKL